jgi:DNA-binding CsgD family transcriptional regulator
MEEAREHAFRSRDRRAIAIALRNLTFQYLRAPSTTHDLGRLRVDTEEAARIFREFGDQRNLVLVLAGLARIRTVAGEADAVESLQESLSLADELNDQLSTTFTAWHALLISDNRLPAETTARLLGIVEALQARMDRTNGFSFDDAFTGALDRETVRRMSDLGRRELGEAAFAEALEAGRAVPLERIPAEVLSLVAQMEATPVAAPPPLAEAGHAESELISPREREVLALIAEGHSNKRIAEELFIAPTTAKFHVTSLLNKLGADTRAQLVAIAAQQGMLAPVDPYRMSAL